MMATKLYMAAKKGDVSHLSGIHGENRTEEEAMNNQQYGVFVNRTQHGNNILHIAARAGRDTFVVKALQHFPFLSDQVNSEGDTPLLVAARFGHLKVVEELANSSSSRQRDVEEGQVAQQFDALIPSHWRVTNLEQGTTVTTALHEALRNKHQNIARYLLGLNPEMAAFDNLAGESPLFLAAESGCELFMSDILLSNQPYSTNGPDGQNALHATRYCCGAIIAKLINQNLDLMRKLDDQGKAAVHYALEGDYWAFLDLMLATDPSIALFPDSDGFTPLLRAASRGSWRACKKILKACPESIEACNHKGQNTLHVSKFRNFFHGLRFIRIPEIWELRNVGDHEGDTPLHLAVKQNHYEKAMLLTLSVSVDLGAVNNRGLTALDLCESDTKFNGKRIMSNYLRSHLAPRGRRPNDHEWNYRGTDWATLDADFKQYINTIILVATLIATVTFAAAVTMPGGFDTSADNLGVATLVKKAALKVFILSDAFAMCCSIIVVLLLSMAILAERDVVPSIAQDSFTLLNLAFFATLVAFMSGIFVVIAPKALWVAISVCIFCSAAPFLIAPNKLPGFPLITLLHPVIYYRDRPGRKQKTEQRNKRKSEQHYVGSLIQRGTPDTTYRVSNTNTAAN